MIVVGYIIKLIKQVVILFFFIINIIPNGENKFNIKERIIRFNKYCRKGNNFKGIQKYLNSIEKYINLIQNNELEFVNYHYDIFIPKISFIVPVFNKEKYLKSLILSIQYQLIKEFEIIFIDDFSSDSSVKIINESSLIDRRIKLIKNKENRGTLYSRILGALQSKGEYIIFIDADDLILQDGLFNSYNYLKKSKLSLVQFNSIFLINNSLRVNTIKYKYKKIIKQPILSHVFFYNYNAKNADEINTALWDKLVKNETIFKAINFIGEKYYNKFIKIENDVILLFSILRMADSYQHINENGYFYFTNHNDSITNSWDNPDISNSIIKGIFINLEFLYEKTGNFPFDKSFVVFKLQQSFKRYVNCFKNAKNEYPFMKYVLELLLNSRFIDNNDKLIISIIYSSITSNYQNEIK